MAIFTWDMREVKLLVSIALVIFPSAITAEMLFPTPGYVVGFTVAIALGGFMAFLLTLAHQSTDQIQLIFEKA